MHMQCQLEWNATSSEHACGTKINHVIDTGYQPSTKEQIKNTPIRTMGLKPTATSSSDGHWPSTLHKGANHSMP